MGASVRSDINTGFALGQAVVQKALARARADGVDRKWMGAVPIGPRGFDLVWDRAVRWCAVSGLSEPRKVRLLAPVAAVQHDAYIASHDAKYTLLASSAEHG
jgi:hypothetical protein